MAGMYTGLNGGRRCVCLIFNTNSFFQQMPHSWEAYVSYYVILPLKEDNKDKSKSHESLLIFNSISSQRSRHQIKIPFPSTKHSNPFMPSGKKRYESKITRFILDSIFITCYYYISVIIAPAGSEAPKDQVQELLQLFSC